MMIGEARPFFRAETLGRHGFPTISYDELEVGEGFRSDERLIRPQDIEAYAYAVDDHDRWFFEPGPFGGPIAHPTLLANQALFLRHTKYVVPAGLHARMTFRFVNATKLGCRARTTGRVIDKYRRRGGPYMVTEDRTADDGDRTLVVGRLVQMLFQGETAPPFGISSSGSDPAPATTPEKIRNRRSSLASARGRFGPAPSRWARPYRR